MKTVKGELELGRFLVPYRIYGEAEKTIICISGAKQTMAAWRSFVSHFVSDYSVVVFDLPGQGRATILSGSPGISFDEQVDVLRNIVKETNRNGTVILAAASWGTIISAALAARHPELIDKMILGSFGAKPSKAVIDVIRAGQELFNTNKTDDIAPLMIEKYPGLKDAQGYKVELEPGETLYIPSGYWHHFVYNEPGYAVSLRCSNQTLMGKLHGYYNLFIMSPIDRLMNILLPQGWFDWKEQQALKSH